MLGFSEATSQAIRALDEHCDGGGGGAPRAVVNDWQEGLEGLEGQEGQEGQEEQEGGFRLKPEDQCRQLSSA